MKHNSKELEDSLSGAIPANFQEFSRYVGGVIPVNWDYSPDTKVEIGLATTGEGIKSYTLKLKDEFDLADSLILTPREGVEGTGLDEDLNLAVKENGEKKVHADWATNIFSDRMNEKMNYLVFSPKTAEVIGVMNTYNFKLRTLFYISALFENPDLKTLATFIAHLLDYFTSK